MIPSLMIRGRELPLISPIQKRDYQIRVIDRSVELYEEGWETIIIESPTGSGKTIMGLGVCKYLRRKYGYNVGWMTMRRTNLAQAKAANDAIFGIDGVSWISMFDRHPPRVDILVSDEVQHDAAESSSHVHAACGARRVLGLSATPFRTDRLKLAFQKCVKDAGIHRLIQDGWLSKYWHYSIDDFTVESVARTYLEDREEWGKTAVYWHRIEDCVAFSRKLAENGVRAEVVDGSTRNVEGLLAEFGDGGFPVLTSVAKLTEGFDCPTLTTVFVRDASKLPTIQMSGRVLRIADGKPHSNIVQSRRARWQFPKTALPEKAFVQRNDHWLCLGQSSIIADASHRNARMLATSPVSKVPDFLRGKPSRTGGTPFHERLWEPVAGTRHMPGRDGHGE